MKKRVTIEKNIEFPTMIGEICAISLDKNLKFIDSSNINGELLLSGKYKLTEASRLEEDFKFEIPIDINLIEKLDTSTINVEIVDFSYELDNDSIICKIELLIEGLEIVEDTPDVLEQDRECDGDSIVEKEIEIPVLEPKENMEKIDSSKVIEENEKEENIRDEEEKFIFTDIDEGTEETYGTFVVYIMRQNESINSIIEKYNTSLEEIEKYNDLNAMEIGSKLIIPLINE